MNKFLLYYPFEFNPDNKFGSGVRMINIYKAFVEYCDANDLELLFVTGNQKERMLQLQKIFNEETGNVIGCYIELPNIPLLLSNKNHIPNNPYVDFFLFRQCKKRNIPVGVFVRDLHWKFEEYRNEGIKHKFSYFLSERYLNFFKKEASLIFLPSFSMNEYVKADVNKVIPLPSGAWPQEIYIVKKDIPEMIFVGSLHSSSNISNVLTALEEINDEKILVNFNLVCREVELDNFIESYAGSTQKKWINIYHRSSDELSELYNRSDFAIMSHKKSAYIDFAMPVKLMEYLSYGMPILSTNINEVSKFLQKNNCAVIVEDDIESIRKGILKMLSIISSEKVNKNEIQNKFIRKNKWTDRVDTIVSSLKRTNEEEK